MLKKFQVAVLTLAILLTISLPTVAQEATEVPEAITITNPPDTIYTYIDPSAVNIDNLFPFAVAGLIFLFSLLSPAMYMLWNSAPKWAQSSISGGAEYILETGEKWAEETPNPMDDLGVKTIRKFLVAVGIVKPETPEEVDFVTYDPKAKAMREFFSGNDSV
jgi:hypothetical protein